MVATGRNADIPVGTALTRSLESSAVNINNGKFRANPAAQHKNIDADDA